MSKIVETREREGRGGLPATFKLSFEHEKWILDGCPTGRKALLAPPYSSELLSAGACVCHKMARNHHPSLLVLAFRLFFMGINLYLTSCFRFTTTIPSCWIRPELFGPERSSRMPKPSLFIVCDCSQQPKMSTMG